MKTPLPLLFALRAACCLAAASVHAAPGDLDLSFGTGGKVTTRVAIGSEGHSMAVQSDGKIVVAGGAWNGNDNDFALVRYLTNGALDPDFGAGGKVTTDFGAYDYGNSVAVQNDGKIVVAGSSFQDFALVRYLANGTLDPDFGTGGKVTTDFGSVDDIGYSVAVQSDGKIIVAGSFVAAWFGGGSMPNRDIAVVRYTASGMLDPEFGTGGKVTTSINSGSNSYGEQANSVAVQSDGKIVVAGYSDAGGANYSFALVRYSTSGALDTGFGTGGKVITSIGSGDDVGYSVAVQRDGKIVVAGSSNNGGNLDFALVRYMASGALDMGFGTGGKVTTPIGSNSASDWGYSVAVQSDGKIVVAGTSRGAYDAIALVRYEGGSPGDSDSDGLLDTWELTYWPTIPEHKALDDFDGDGVPELLEEAFGLNPTLPDAASLPQPVNEGGYLTITFTKHAGVTYEVQSAGTLLDGQPGSFSPATTTVLLDTTTLKVRDNVLIGTTPARYMRVKVTAAP